MPILFRLIDAAHAGQMLDRMASGELSSDWGARMLTNASRLYDPISYNNGAVWPFLNGLLSWAEFRNHRGASGFAHWIQNARLTTVHALGFLPELLSGDFYAPMDTAVPHQLFSSSGVLTPLVKGMLGFYPAVHERTIRLEPHLPVRWNQVSVRNLKAGSGSLHLDMTRTPAEAAFRVASSGLDGFRLEFSPGFEAGAQVKRILLNGKPVEPTCSMAEDLHCDLGFPLSGKDEVRFELIPGLRIVEPDDAPLPGDPSRQLRILHVSWDRNQDRYSIEVEGRSGSTYALEVNTPRKPARVEGAIWRGTETAGTLTIAFPAAAQEYTRRTIVVGMRP